MNLQYFTLKLRTLIAVIAAASLFTVFLKYYFILILELNDTIYNESKIVSCSWTTNKNPVVCISNFSGSIYVAPSGSKLLRIESLASSRTKVSSAESRIILDDIRIKYYNRDNTYFAECSSNSGTHRGQEVTINAFVPDGVDLRVHTKNGSMFIGRAFAKGIAIHCPIKAICVEAFNDSQYKQGYSQGDVVVETLSIKGGDALECPTRLKLAAPGRIAVIADLATIDARARHGIPPLSWPKGSYESLDEGTIAFDGLLAPGKHILKSAHNITLRLTNTSRISVNCIANEGTISGKLISQVPGQDSRISDSESPSNTSSDNVYVDAEARNGNIIIDKLP